jgi:nucleoside phosphorylase
LWSLLAHEEGLLPYPDRSDDQRSECEDWARVLDLAEKRNYISISKKVSSKVSLTAAGRREAQRLRAVYRDFPPQDKPSPSVHLGPIGTSAMVHKDERLFSGLQRLLRTITAIDMECAAIGDVAHKSEMPFLVVKSVVDYADLEKSDHFRSYSCSVSAAFMLDFFLKRRSAMTLIHRDS